MVSALPLVSGCAGTASRTPPRAALLDASRRGREPPPSPGGAAALTFAASQIGHPYCWGGTGPACFDCSGLVTSAWRAAGFALPRTSGALGAALHDVPIDEVRPGDVLWWPGHVALYAGGGMEIEALDRTHGVLARPAADPVRVLRPD